MDNPEDVPEYLQESFDPSTKTISALRSILSEAGIYETLPTLTISLLKRKQDWVNLCTKEIVEKRQVLYKEWMKRAIKLRRASSSSRSRLVADQAKQTPSSKNVDEEEESSSIKRKVENSRSDAEEQETRGRKSVRKSPRKTTGNSRSNSRHERPTFQGDIDTHFVSDDENQGIPTFQATPLKSASQMKTPKTTRRKSGKLVETPFSPRSDLNVDARRNESPARRFINIPGKVMLTPAPTSAHLLNIESIKKEPTEIPRDAIKTSPQANLNYSSTSETAKAMLAAGTPISRRTGKKKRSSSRRRDSLESSSFGWIQVQTWCLVAFIAMLSLWVTEWSSQSKYCTHDKPVSTYRWNPLFSFWPCVPCPQDSRCKGRKVMGCVDEENMILKPSVLVRWAPRMLKDKIPFPWNQPLCVEDTDKEERLHRLEENKRQKLKQLSLLILETVVDWMGKCECGELQERVEPFVWDSTVLLGMPISLCKKRIQQQVSEWTPVEFEDIWGMWLASAADKDADTIQMILDPTGSHRLLRPVHQHPKRSLPCRIRMFTFSKLKQYSPVMLLSGLLVIAGVVAYQKRQTRLRQAKIVSILVEDVLDMVYEESENFRKDPIRHPVPGLSVVQLRDFFMPMTERKVRESKLSDTSSVKVSGFEDCGVTDKEGRTRWYFDDDKLRNDIWSHVSQFVLMNSNIRETGMEVNTEVHTVWQWVGSHALSPK